MRMRREDAMLGLCNLCVPKIRSSSCGRGLGSNLSQRLNFHPRVTYYLQETP